MYISWQMLFKAHDWFGTHCQKIALQNLSKCRVLRWLHLVDVFAYVEKNLLSAWASEDASADLKIFINASVPIGCREIFGDD